jgi:hypothetical protein
LDAALRAFGKAIINQFQISLNRSADALRGCFLGLGKSMAALAKSFHHYFVMVSAPQFAIRKQFAAPRKINGTVLIFINELKALRRQNAFAGQNSGAL